MSNFPTEFFCGGLYYDESPNPHTVGGKCGLLSGIPKRKDNSSSILFEMGTNGTMPLYSCATANRAIIKTVSFRFNGSRALEGLNITDIKPKAYSDKSK